MFIYIFNVGCSCWLNRRLLVLAQDWWDTGSNLYSAGKFGGQFISLGLPYLQYPSLFWRKLQLVCLQTPTQVFYHLYESIWRKKRGGKIVCPNHGSSAQIPGGVPEVHIDFSAGFLKHLTFYCPWGKQKSSIQCGL